MPSITWGNKTEQDEFSNPRKAGIISVDLDEGDFLVGAGLTDGKHDVMLFSDGGKAVRFDENDVRPMGRNARLPDFPHCTAGLQRGTFFAMRFPAVQ